ncbi:hypothetical protein MMC26_003630 [Xylographa opegraphella]|nr:hypothetical protein [Xylographa opegraphella]
MAFRPNGSTPDLSWQPHAWKTIRGAAAEDGRRESRLKIATHGPCTEELCVNPIGYYKPTRNNQHSSIANDFQLTGGGVDIENNLTQQTMTWAHHTLSINHDDIHSEGSNIDVKSANYGSNCQSDVTSGVSLCTQSRPFDFLPNIAVAGQSSASFDLLGFDTRFTDTSIPCDQRAGSTAPFMVLPALQGSSTFTEYTQLPTRSYSVTNSSRFPCLLPGCMRTFGRIADLDRHYKKHVPNAAKFYCYEVGYKYNSKPFYRRDKLLSHQRNMHGASK